jgi:hypothetical protein
METLQRAMDRAVERHNMARFTPVGHARELAVTTLRLAVEALAEDNTTLAAAILDQVQPESPDNSTATVAACIGITLGLLDDWLSGHDPNAPARAFRSLGPLIARQGGEHVLYGSVLALSAAIQAWSHDTGTPVPELAHTTIR